MKWALILLILFPLMVSAHADEPAGIIHDAELKFKNGEIQAGKALLESLSDADHLSVAQKAAANNKLAWFYEKLVGNYAYAERYSRNVLRFSLPELHREKIEARNRIRRLEQHASKYREANRILDKLKIEASSRNDAENKIKALKRFVQNNPDYPDLAVVHHYIGKHYLYLEKYYTGYRVLANVLKTRPGIIFLLPTESLMNTAKSKWTYFLVDVSAKLIIVISLIIIAAALFLSKFWERINFKSFIILPIILLGWALFLLAGAWGLNFFIPHQKHLYLDAPIFIQTTPFSPGSEILFTIFLYGGLGIIASFLLTLATRNSNWPKVRIWINAAMLILFTSAVFARFYLNHCDSSGIFEKRAGVIFPVATGHTYLRQKDYEPLILTRPRDYPDLTLSNSKDKYFNDWVRKQYAVIAGQSAENGAIKQRQSK